MATPPDLGAVAPGEGPLDELLAALMKAGEVDSQGAFTLDRQKAREKMQRFQLAESARYVLELVQAAVLRGARHITVEIEYNDIHLRCDATPFTLQDFEQIYDALFIRSRADKRQALRHLALGASTALSLKPAWVLIEGGGTQGAYLQMFPGDKEKMGASAPSDIGLHVHVHQRGRRGFLRQLLGYYQAPKPSEFELLREHCGLSMVPIEINGLPIAAGYQLPGTMHWLHYRHGNTRGVIGVLGYVGIQLPPGYPFALRSTMHLLRNCVSFEIDLPALLLPGFGTLVESPSFHLDISHQKVVRNDSYEEAVRLVLAKQIQLLIRECKRLNTVEQGLEREMLAGLVLALLSRLGSVDPLLRWAGRDDAGPTLVPRGFPEQVAGAAALLTARLWPTTSKGWVALDDIGEDLQTFGTLAVTPIRGADGERPLVLLLSDAAAREVFANVFTGKPEPRRGAAVGKSEPVVSTPSRRRYYADAKLPPGPYLAIVPIHTDQVQGQLGIEWPPYAIGSSGPCEPTLTLFYLGGAPVAKKLAVPLPGLHAVLASDFSPTPSGDDVEPDARLAMALWGLLGALPALVARILETVDQHALEPTRQGALRELALLSRSLTAQAALLHKLGLPAPLTAPEPVALFQLLGMPMFETLEGELLSLAQLREHSAAHGYLAVVNAQDSGMWRGRRSQFHSLVRNNPRFGKTWQRVSADRPSTTLPPGAAEKAPPALLLWQSGPVAILREALSDRFPPEQLWDATGWLAELATTFFPTPVVHLNYERLRRSQETNKSSAPAEAEHAEILDLVDAHSVLQIDAVLQRLMQRTPQEPVRAAAVRAELRAEALATAALQKPAGVVAAQSEVTLLQNLVTTSAVDTSAATRSASTDAALIAAATATTSALSAAAADDVARVLLPLQRLDEERMLGMLTTEFCAVVGSAHKLLANVNLGQIRIGESAEPLAVVCTEHATLLNRNNAAVRRALGSVSKDPTAVWFLLSALYTALHIQAEVVSADDEAQFLSLLTQRAIAELRIFALPL